MAKLTIVRGVSGSGKSTWAKAQYGAVVVSRDTLREFFFGTSNKEYYEVDKDVLKSREALVTKAHDNAVIEALSAGYDVIVDNTHIEWKFVQQTANLAAKVPGTVVFIKTFDVDLATAQERNKARAESGGRFVPGEVIKKQHQRLQGTKTKTVDDLRKPQEVKPYTGTPGKPKAFLVDIDGTLAHMRDYRSPYDWKNVHKDDVDEVIADIVQFLHVGSEESSDPYKVIVMSGRDAACRGITEEWLEDHGIWFDVLFMRPEDDMRKDNIIKAELFDKYVRDNYDVKFVLDDRDQVVEMWRSMGLKCLQVEPGDF